jgi:hypothetical protein
VCEQHLASLVLAHKRGIQHLHEELMTLNSSIVIGGFLSIPNLIWDPNANHKCSLHKIDICQSAAWHHHRGVKMSCFKDREKLMDWSMKTLGAINDLIEIIPNDAIDYESFLPFPNLFNITIINVKQSVSLCPKSNSVACHKRMSKQGQCSFYLCHTTASTDLMEITLKYEPTQVAVKMLFMCHPEGPEDNEREVFGSRFKEGDRICHILRPQTSFFLCEC